MRSRSRKSYKKTSKKSSKKRSFYKKSRVHDDSNILSNLKYVKLDRPINIIDPFIDFDNIIDFLKDSDLPKIKEDFFKRLNRDIFCEPLLGSGAFGSVFLPVVNSILKVNIPSANNVKNIIELESVLKIGMGGQDYKTKISINEHNNIMYITGRDTIITEAIILMFVNKLWNKTLHLPLLLGYSTCNNDQIPKIITLKHGLRSNIKVNIPDNTFYHDNTLLNANSLVKEFNSNLATLNNLIEFINLTRRQDGIVELPNGQKCDVFILFDYIRISYLATQYMLAKNNIFVSDTHSSNIFIHWIHESPYLDHNLSEIVYEINNKMYKIKTFGFVIILGDLGMSIVKVKDNLIIVGHADNIEKSYTHVNDIIKSKTHWNDRFFEYCTSNLIKRDYIKTAAYKLLNSDIYLDSTVNMLASKLKMDFYKNIKTSDKILEEFYSKYEIDRFIQKPDNILIKC